MKYTTSTVAMAVALVSGSQAYAVGRAPPQDSVPASAQDTAPQAVAPVEAEPAGDILVLGTRRTDRTLANSASPVDIISSADLTTQPAANMIDALKNIVPSFYAGQNSISDASTFVRSPSLRGLSGDQVLVMLNGKRYNRSALVQVYGGSDTGLGRGAQGPDISAIPSLAIGNLQVLREGATAQYGSDAIAGVLNYGLREDQGIELVGRTGQYYAGDGESYQIAGNAGIKGDWGFINATGEYVDEGQTSRGRTRPSAANFAQNFPELASQLPNYPLPVQIWGNSPSHGFKSVLNAAINVTPDSKLYFFGNYAENKGNQSFNYRASVSSTAVDTNGVVRNQGANGAFNNTFFLTPAPLAARPARRVASCATATPSSSTSSTPPASRRASSARLRSSTACSATRGPAATSATTCRGRWRATSCRCRCMTPPTSPTGRRRRRASTSGT
ncbi:Plug domain-containing protein [Sphingomonas sp. LR59]|uniref:TonB-dependent receptor plug domain-containing protein n=1 Tax=Sphingomonas sp. LR59 TaxID=3050232 RepID=UPI002FE0CC91